MNATVERPSSGIAEVDLVVQNVDILREKLLNFRDILGNKFIDHPKEKDCQKAVLRQLDRYEQARQIAERAASYKYGPETSATIHEALDDARETTAEDVLDYHRAMLTFDRRTDEYNQASILARQFLSPRTRFNEAWETEDRVGRSAFPEVNMFFIVVAVFAVLLVVSMFSSPAIEARCKEHPTVFQIESVSDMKTFTLSDIACTLRQSLLALYRAGQEFSKAVFGNGPNEARWIADDIAGSGVCIVQSLSNMIKSAEKISRVPTATVVRNYTKVEL